MAHATTHPLQGPAAKRIQDNSLVLFFAHGKTGKKKSNEAAPLGLAVYFTVPELHYLPACLPVHAFFRSFRNQNVRQANNGTKDKNVFYRHKEPKARKLNPTSTSLSNHKNEKQQAAGLLVG
jgi:hypothetical protein